MKLSGGCFTGVSGLEMRNRTLTPNCIIDITRIPGLDYIRYEEGGLKIGVLATLRAVERSDIVKGKFLSSNDATFQTSTKDIVGKSWGERRQIIHETKDNTDSE